MLCAPCIRPWVCGCCQRAYEEQAPCCYGQQMSLYVYQAKKRHLRIVIWHDLGWQSLIFTSCRKSTRPSHLMHAKGRGNIEATSRPIIYHFCTVNRCGPRMLDHTGWCVPHQLYILTAQAIWPPLHRQYSQTDTAHGESSWGGYSHDVSLARMEYLCIPSLIFCGPWNHRSVHADHS